MTNITTRASKGAPLSWNEADANFTNLNTYKLEVSNNLSDVSNPTAAKSNLGLGNVDNTSDINKPISTATQTALDGKQDVLPSQTGNNGKFLGTNGTTLSWNTVDALPSQTGNNGKFLTTNGITASWTTAGTGDVTLNGTQTLTNKTLVGPKLKNAQLGNSAIATQNFTLTAEAADGTMKLARGNAGATTQDILTVDASGNVLVDGNNLNLFSAKSLAASGYQRLPSGLIIQWGKASFPDVPVNSTPLWVTFPLTFPTNVYNIVVTAGLTAGFNVLVMVDESYVNTSGFQGMLAETSGGTQSGGTYRWIAIGN